MAANSRTIQITQVREWQNGIATTKTDYLAAEEPLEIRIGDTPISVTMRTPGHDRELAAGFLFTEGLLASRKDLVALEVATTPHVGEGTDDAPSAMNNAVVATLADGVATDLERLRRH